ncbi:hypothetical protein EWH99_12190 [Sporolactobacillus sp. THM7-7]|nr:hypothetical protein EWH99_12190 [Sporolactobacillus sp. THM7-7]
MRKKEVLIYLWQIQDYQIRAKDLGEIKNFFLKFVHGLKREMENEISRKCISLSFLCLYEMGFPLHFFGISLFPLFLLSTIFPCKKVLPCPSPLPHPPQTLAALSSTPSFFLLSSVIKFFPQRPIFPPISPLFSALACIEYSANVKKMFPEWKEESGEKKEKGLEKPLLSSVSFLHSIFF